MLLVAYLTQEQLTSPAVEQRLRLADAPMVLVTARTVPELINQVQTLPVRAILCDLAWPRTIWEQLETALRELRLSLPKLALSPAATELDWWQFADDLLRLDEDAHLFLHRLLHACGAERTPGEPAIADLLPTTPRASASAVIAPRPGLLENPQFRQFAEMFSQLDEHTLTEAFIAWAQQACLTSRAVLLLREPESGSFTCASQRGLSSTLARHCRFPQTAPLCRWLAASGRILTRDAAPAEASAGLELMQAVAAIPMMYDGQLVGILGIGPRLVGDGYSAAEFEALFAIGEQIALSVQHHVLHRTVQRQQEMTEHMLSAMPTGTIVLGDQQRIAFVNQAAAGMLGRERATLQGNDLRALPSPLGDMAYEVLVSHGGLPRREITIHATGRPVAVSSFLLSTTPPSAMLMLEDLTAIKQLAEERERRVNLEVVTNLVHYLAHELRNPLVSLSTFSNLVHTHAKEPDFQEFCESVLLNDIGRVNLILEQLLVLTNDVQLHFNDVPLGPLVERVTAGSEELRECVVAAVPVSLPTIYADGQRLETALTCVIRTAVRVSRQQAPVTAHVETDETMVTFRAEAPAQPEVAPEWLLNPWQQLLEGSDEHVDLGLATAQYILEQHEGTLVVEVTDNILTIECRLPVRPAHREHEEGWDDAKESARRRR